MSLSVFNPIFMSFVAISSCLAYVAVPGPDFVRFYPNRASVMKTPFPTIAILHPSYSNVESWEKTWLYWLSGYHTCIYRCMGHTLVVIVAAPCRSQGGFLLLIIIITDVQLLQFDPLPLFNNSRNNLTLIVHRNTLL